MGNRKIFVLLLATIGLSCAEVQLITKPEPGHEYVFLQTSAAGSRPVERKEKPSENERVFETAHKLPPSLTFALNDAQDEEMKATKESKVSKPKREALPEPGDGPAPAPAGAIKLDVQKLLEKYKTDLKTSTTQKPATTTKNKSKRPSGRSSGNRRTKKEAHDESVIATSPSSILTTSSAGLRPIEQDDDVPLVASGSEKQRSRIQIKKGPNGQEYEYEYVYYYYDDDETPDKESSKEVKATNAHDGPARNEITPQSQSRSRGGSTPEPAVNEVLPTSRGRSRGRQLEDEDVSEERLPANTRFPPRSRNLNTTPVPADDSVEDTKPSSRSRGRGRPETNSSSESDNTSEETQGSRGRTRANVRRPSLELVDSASFNTHTSSGEPPNGSGPSFPTDLPAGPVRFLGATPNERMDVPNNSETKSVDKKDPAPVNEDEEKDETTTMMSPMDKVALDLYAILQGTQRLSGEGDLESETEITTESEPETTTLEMTTEIPTTEATIPTTTTTTTTTTTPAPTTTVAETGFGRGKYRSRPGGIGNRKIGTSTTTTEAPAETKPKSRFGRPSFGSRPRARTTAAPSEQAEQSEHKEEAKPVGATRTRSRFGAARTRATTQSPSENSDSNPSVAPSRPSLRPRPTFNLRSRTRPTPAPSAEGDSSPAASEEPQNEPSTTTRSRPRINASNVRPLRPGPRINLSGGRGRLGATTPAPETPEPAPVVEEDQEKPKEAEDTPKEPETTPAPDTNPLSRLRNRQRSPLQVRPAAPKAAASAPVQVRRVNPLISRRKPIGETSTTEAPASESPATEDVEEVEDGATEAAPSSTTTTTEEPKGLNKLLAGRRRLALRQPGTIA